MNRRSVAWLLLSVGAGACSASAADPLSAPCPQGPCGKSAALTNGPGPVFQSLESKLTVPVAFNPKEIGVDKHVSWQKHKNSEGDAPTLEFISADPLTMNIDLMFDGFETKTDVSKVFVAKLEELAAVDPALKRPPLVRFTWGAGMTFTGVIARLNVKYTLFMEDGTPVRATCRVRMREAGGATSGHQDRCRGNSDCRPGFVCGTSGTCVVKS